jgi:hypothetical protein
VSSNFLFCPSFHFSFLIFVHVGTSFKNAISGTSVMFVPASGTTQTCTVTSSTATLILWFVCVKDNASGVCELADHSRLLLCFFEFPCIVNLLVWNEFVYLCCCTGRTISCCFYLICVSVFSTYPAGEGTGWNIRVTIDGLAAANPTPWNYDAPSISGITPNPGVAGSTLTVNGKVCAQLCHTVFSSCLRPYYPVLFRCFAHEITRK